MITANALFSIFANSAITAITKMIKQIPVTINDAIILPPLYQMVLLSQNDIFQKLYSNQ
jgi:hypothetical protein